MGYSSLFASQSKINGSMSQIFCLNLQALLTGEYHQQKILERKKKAKEKKDLAQKWELEKKCLYEEQLKYVALVYYSALLQETVPDTDYLKRSVHSILMVSYLNDRSQTLISQIKEYRED
jgi:hypothetical protein